MANDDNTAVPGSGAPSGASTSHTGAESTPPAAPESLAAHASAQSSEPAAPLNRDDVAAIVREGLSSALPEVAQQFEGRLERFAQSASDKRFANLMRELAPEMRGIDSAVRRGLMDAQSARQAKTEMLLERAAQLGAEEREPRNAPAAPRGFDWHAAGMQMIRDSGLTPAEIPELARGSVAYDRLPAIIARVKAEKEIAARKDAMKVEWMKEYEQSRSAVRSAEQQGALTPPPRGGSAADTNNLNPYTVESRELYRKGLSGR
ncbi:MAG: hypothetical protein M1482_12720 [Chloroflexi bacterium]|nr:hypothetical protein [Chloroflexota bacterium]